MELTSVGQKFNLTDHTNMQITSPFKNTDKVPV